MIGSPPMPTQVDWPKPGPREAVDDLVGQRPRARDHPDVARLKTCAGMIPTSDLPGEISPGQLPPMMRIPASC